MFSRPAVRLLGDVGQRQIVGGDQPQSAAVHQAADHRLGADPPVVGVGAVEDLVEQEEHGSGPSHSETTCCRRWISA